MNRRIAITVADVVVELTTALSAAELGLVRGMEAFLGTPPHPADRVRLALEVSDATPAVPGELIYRPGPQWRLHRCDGDYYAAFSFSDEEDSIAGVLRANPDWDDLSLVERRRGADWCSLLGMGAGELLFRSRILYSGGLIFHSSSLDDNGRGVVFVGHSGAGKSTQLGLWDGEPGVVAMSDDRSVVRVDGNGARCYGTPWRGTSAVARNHSAPLATLMLLEQGPRNIIERLAPSEAVPLLAARAFLPYWDRGLMQRALRNLGTIVCTVPIYRFACRPDKSVIPLVRSLL